MTVQAPLLVHNRPMHQPLIESVIDHIVMTALTEFITGALGGKRLCRRRGRMALTAHALRHRVMDVVVQHPRGIGTVRIVARRAVALFDRITGMPGLERFLLWIMTL